MKINGKEIDISKLFSFRKIEIYCHKEDILFCSFNISKPEFEFSDRLNKKLKTLKINNDNVKTKLASKLKYRYLKTPNSSLYQFIANCVNEIISEMVKRNNRILEIE